MFGVNKSRVFTIALVAGVLLVSAVLVIHWAARTQETPLEPSAMAADGGGGDGADSAAVSVLTIHPKADPSFAMTVTEPADVKPYYETYIESHVAGEVEFIRKARGSPVKAGEPIVQISVPDLERELELKNEIVKQKRAEQAYTEAKVGIAEAAVERAQRDIKLREADVQTARANNDYRRQELARFTRMAGGQDPAVTPDVVDERRAVAIAAKAALDSALQAVERAKADLQEMQSKLLAAHADVDLQKTYVRVAERDRDLAQAMLDFATIKAPYDGFVTRRNIDPGSFVQSATTGHSEPLLIMQRTDIVTVWVKLPDIYAAYVTPDTAAVIQMNDLPGRTIHVGRITRYDPSLLTEAHDRTMRVEVDLYNGTREQYTAFLAKEQAKKHPFDDLKEGSNPLHLFPRIEDKNVKAEACNLLPGMYGKMTLVLRKFKDAYLIPSSAIVRQAGVPYVYLAGDGVAHLQQVEVQVNDEKLAKVLLVEKAGLQTVKKNLTGKEEIVDTNQGELSDGTPINGSLVEWTP